MSETISVRLSSDLMEKIVQEAKEKKCSQSELIRQKIIFTYEQEDKEKTIIDLEKMDGNIKSLINLLIMNSAFIAEYIRQEKGIDSWMEIFNNAKEILEEYRKTGKLFI
jgi:Arc/MetJ-type ribon-helix-helix transcriptional regulator